MTRFLLVRVPSALVTLVLALGIAFLLTRASGDPVREMLGVEATAEQVHTVRHELGLDRSLPAQFVSYLGDVAQLKLGDSIRFSQSNWDLIAGRALASLELAAAALCLAIVGGLLLGTVSAVREGDWLDRLASSCSLFGQSVPLFWLGLMLVLVFAVRLHLLPAGQDGGIDHLVLPAVTLATLPMAGIARLTRASMAEVLHQPYITAARARGLRGWQIILVHGFRNGALPVLTLIGLQAGALFSGAVTVEYVFSWPGLGTLATQAVQFRDFTLVQAIVAFGAILFVGINLVVDLMYGLIDPRTRASA